MDVREGQHSGSENSATRCFQSNRKTTHSIQNLLNGNIDNSVVETGDKQCTINILSSLMHFM